jgi:two-component system, chemotaxis family, sensor kinase CheA
MEGLLSGLPGVAGTTLLGDGRVLIILDLPDLLQ